MRFKEQVLAPADLCAIREVQTRKIELAGGVRTPLKQASPGPAVQEGSGASVTWDPNETPEE